MLPQHLPELGKTSKDSRTTNLALKYVAIAAIAICTIAVSALFVKVYVLPAEQSLHNKIGPIKEDKEPIKKNQDEVYVVDLDIEFEPISTITPTLNTKPYKTINQESSEDKNNNLKRKQRKSHVFQSTIPANVATELTNDEETVNPIENSNINNEDSYLIEYPFRAFNFTDEKEQKIDNESRKYFDNLFEKILNYLIKTSSDSEETDLTEPTDDLFEPTEPLFDFSNPDEEIFTPSINPLQNEDFTNFLTDSEVESESTNSSSNEISKLLQFPIINNTSFDNF